jgi:hypothetical protein
MFFDTGIELQPELKFTSRFVGRPAPMEMEPDCDWLADLYDRLDPPNVPVPPEVPGEDWLIDYADYADFADLAVPATPPEPASLVPPSTTTKSRFKGRLRPTTDEENRKRFRPSRTNNQQDVARPLLEVKAVVALQKSWLL